MALDYTNQEEEVNAHVSKQAASTTTLIRITTQEIECMSVARRL
jgi:hypothetical protein